MLGLVMLSTIGGWCRDAAALEISEETNSSYQWYLRQIGSTKRGAFVVSADGLYSYYVYCDVSNNTDTAADEARQRCKGHSGDKDCVLMARNGELQIEITV